MHSKSTSEMPTLIDVSVTPWPSAPVVVGVVALFGSLLLLPLLPHAPTSITIATAKTRTGLNRRDRMQHLQETRQTISRKVARWPSPRKSRDGRTEGPGRCVGRRRRSGTAQRGL